MHELEYSACVYVPEYGIECTCLSAWKCVHRVECKQYDLLYEDLFAPHTETVPLWQSLFDDTKESHSVYTAA